jgi:hypothetical protein
MKIQPRCAPQGGQAGGEASCNFANSPEVLLGSAKGQFVVPDNFNDPLPKEIEDLFWK